MEGSAKRSRQLRITFGRVERHSTTFRSDHANTDMDQTKYVLWLVLRRSITDANVSDGSISLHLPDFLPQSPRPQYQSRAPSKASAEATASYEGMKTKRAWDLAISPAKSLPMQAFMLYMSGGGVQIFSMGIVFMLLLSPFKNLAALNSVFAPFAPASSSPRSFTTLPLQKVVYLICNILTLALGLWKCRSMGLLPTGTGDWLAFETRGRLVFTLYETIHAHRSVVAA
ncbi:ER membrane protein complex subunit 4 [Grifola frondosa]|uniref:ER membrane protein complex subunit 4 n=1 Tax=Grifola frondosa TaxID=5627 RepID=A0A1C7M6Q4_GRIFR|nr:ER membrane protein complex subunit 4 [Grifola frondosa]